MARKPDHWPVPTGGATRMSLDAHLVEGFTQVFLMDGFDEPCPIPDFHRELWQLFCAPDQRVAIAAPRGHAKSSAGTYAYGLASAVFGEQDFILIVGATEDLAARHLADIAVTIETNELLAQTFNLHVITSNETELVCRCGGREFCFVGKGAGQKVRGIKWRQKRPGLVLIDDLEEDEAVMNPERRKKSRDWFQNALLPCGHPRTKYRMVGTILHLDSILERNLKSRAWLGKRFRAHADFSDFSGILWPERFNEKNLRDIQQMYIEEGNASGYSQEYLSHPIADIDSYFRKSDILPMSAEDRRKPRAFYSAIDFAISKSQKADNTSITVGGMDPEGMLAIPRVHKGRWDSLEIINAMFEIQIEYQPEFWIAEAGAIQKALGPFLRAEMIKRNIFMNIIEMVPTKDKEARARSIQARMRAGGVLFDTEAEWYPSFEQELLSFPRGIHDDQVDSLAWLGLGLDKFWESSTVIELEESEWEELHPDEDQGRSLITGY